MTNILALPVYGFDIRAGNNEDLNRSYAYVDDQVVSVTIYDGGTAVGGTGYTGSLPATFGIPASGLGNPAIGTASVANGVLQAVAIVAPGAGYQATEQVGLSIPGAGPDVIVAVLVGNPIALDGLIIDFEVRPSAGSPLVLLSASTQPTIESFPITGVISLYQNVMTITFVEAVMKSLAAGSYVFEARAYADGATRVILKGNFIVDQGVSFERG